MADASPLAIPGYYWDSVKRRYFRSLPTGTPHASSSGSTSSPGGDASSRPTSKHSIDRKGKRRAYDSETPKNSKRAEHDAQRVTRRPTSSRRSHTRFGLELDIPPSRLTDRFRLKSRIFEYASSHPRSNTSHIPTVPPIGEDITAIHALTDPHTGRVVVRLGGSYGTIAQGSLFPDTEASTRRVTDEERRVLGLPEDTEERAETDWRVEWAMSSPITSIGVCGARIVATCLGPPASAVISPMVETISHASIILTPRNTSLWTSSLSPRAVALGSDNSVLTCPADEPAMTGGGASTTMTPYPAKSAVYAIEQGFDTIFAGTRGGKVLLFDRRSSHPRHRINHGAEARPKGPQTLVDIDGAVTHLKLLNAERQLLVAGTSDYLALHDLRFLPSSSTKSSHPVTRSQSPPSASFRPLLTFKGHKNAYLRDLGFAVFDEKVIIAAGQDKRIRSWSLSDGAALPRRRAEGSNGRSGQGGEGADEEKVYGERVKALAVVDDWPQPLTKACWDDTNEGMRRRRGFRGPCVIIADGAALQCFSVFS